MKKYLVLLVLLFLTACKIDSKLITITFQTNGGETISSLVCSAGEEIILPTPIKTGYTFDGWQTSSEVYFEKGTFYLDTTVYARWKINHFNVLFYDFNGSVISTQSVRYGQNAVSPTISLLEGYSFLRWDKDFSNITAPLEVFPIYEQYTSGLEFTLIDDYYVISNYHGQDSAIIIPSTYNLLPVKKIGSKAFYSNYLVQSINLPNTIDEIQDEAFYECLYLSDINFPLNINYIGNMAFYSCELLISVNLNAKVIGEGAFHSCSNLNSVTLSSNVEELKAWSFYNCSGLKTIFLPASINSLGDHVFSWARNLTTVYTPSTNLERLQTMFNNITQIYLHKNFHIEGKTND